MLTPDEIAAIGEYLMQLFQGYEDEVIRDIARRIAKTGELTETAQQQIVRLMDLGVDQSDIARLTAKLLDMSDEAIAELMEYAAEKSTEFRDAVFERAGTSQRDILGSAQTQRMLEAAVSQTQHEMRNITRSMGFRGRDGVWRSCAQAYQRALDAATLQVTAGTMSHQQAVRSAVQELADAGISFVDYASGWVNRADVAARRACLTGVSQLTGELSVQNAETLDTDYVEVTAHMGARPEHAEWQGKVYKLNGSEPGYPNLAAATGYGTGPGLKGWNCRHDFYPFFPGIDERAYTDEDLRNIDPPPFEYDGKTYTAYEASQRQRQMETAMRRTKRRIMAADGAGLTDDFTAESIKLRRQREMYREFSHKAHLPTQEDRMQVLGFGHSMSSKAVWAERKFTIAQEHAKMLADIKEKSGVKGSLNIPPKAIDTATLLFDDAHINGVRKHNVSFEDAKRYINTAIVSSTAWKGQREYYYSEEGAAYVDIPSNMIKTAFSKDEYDERIKMLLYEVKKYEQSRR